MKKLLVLLLCLALCNAKDYLKYYCKEYGIEIALVRSIRHAETLSGRLKGNRYEHHLKKKTWYTNILTKQEMTNNDCFRSLGQMQILYGTAKILGFKGTPNQLKQPKYNYKYAIKYIDKLINRYWNIERVVSAYNIGYPFKNDKTGLFRNQDYVDRVLRYYRIARGKIKVK